MTRRHGTGSVLLDREHGTLRLQYYIRGKRVREATGLPPEKRAQAERLLRKRLEAADSGMPVELRKTTWDDLAALVLADYAVNQRRSVDAVERRLGRVTSAFGGWPATRITPDQIATYVAARLAEGAANATVNRELAALRRAFRLGHQLGRIGYVPPVKLLKEPPGRRGFFERHQLDAVVAKLPPDLVPIARVAYITGWRRNELLSRRWHHVDLAAGWLRLEPGETKSGAGRQFPFTDELGELLAGQRRRTTELERARGEIIPWVFHRNGRQIRSMVGAWRRACREAGLPGKLLHDFRRTAVRNLERSGVPRSAAMAMVGHQTEAIYRRYAIVEESMLREAARKLEQLK